MTLDGHSMEAMSDAYQTLYNSRNNAFVISNLPEGPRNNAGQNKQGFLCCNERSNVITSICLGLLCILLLACIVTQHVKYTEIGKSLSEVDEKVQKGWWYYNSSVYYISEFNEKKKWTESRDYCRGRDADLVIINSYEEQKFIEKLSLIFQMDVWIGLTNRDHIGVLKWVDGFPLTNRFWTLNVLSNEHCVTSTRKRTWEANSCSCENNFICEKNIF